MAHILLIEPDMVLATTYRRAFERAGWGVSWAATAQTALDAADAQLPDVVVLELQLAAHSGIEFLYEFRSYPEWLQVPVIINSFTPPTAFTNADELRARLGVAAHHYKSNTKVAQLIASIREQLVTA